jgi:hypothetical protein
VIFCFHLKFRVKTDLRAKPFRRLR